MFISNILSMCFLFFCFLIFVFCFNFKKVRRAHFLYLAASSSLKASNGGGVVTSAVPATLECQISCQKLGLRDLQSRLAILRSKVQLKRGNALEGLRELDSALPNVLAHCDAQVQGDAHLCRAKCLLSMASKGVKEQVGEGGHGGEKRKRLSRRTFVEVCFLIFRTDFVLIGSGIFFCLSYFSLTFFSFFFPLFL